MKTENESILLNFKSHLATTKQSLSTQSSYWQDAKYFLRYLDLNRITFSQVSGETLLHYSKDAKAKGIQPNSIRRRMIGIRTLYRYLVQEHQITTSPFDDMPLPNRTEIALPKSIVKELVYLFETKKVHSLKEKRDLAILALVSLEGLRVSEVINLKECDFMYNAKISTLSITPERKRILKLQSITTSKIVDYLEKKKTIYPAPNSVKTQDLFLGFQGRNASIILPKVTRHGVKHMIYQWAAELGVKKLNSEILRHICIEFQIDQGRSPDEIMTHLGLRRLGNISKHFSLTKK